MLLKGLKKGFEVETAESGCVQWTRLDSILIFLNELWQLLYKIIAKSNPPAVWH